MAVYLRIVLFVVFFLPSGEIFPSLDVLGSSINGDAHLNHKNPGKQCYSPKQIICGFHKINKII